MGFLTLAEPNTPFSMDYLQRISMSMLKPSSTITICIHIYYCFLKEFTL